MTKVVLRGSLESLIKRAEVLLIEEDKLFKPHCVICGVKMDFRVIKEDNTKYSCCG